MNYFRKGIALFLMIALIVSNAFALEPLKVGSKGQEVKKMQTRLKELGFYNSGIDGDYGNKSKEAVKKFQAKNGLNQDGIASIETLELLYSDEAISKDGKNKVVAENAKKQTEVSSLETFTPGLTKVNFSRFWNDKLNYKAASDAFISMAYGGSPSVIYSYDIRISESSNTASFIITCYNPQSYTKDRINEYYDEFVSSILKSVGYQNTKKDWKPYITYGMSGSKKHVYINGYDFYFYTRTTHEYPNYTGRNGVDMLEYHLDVSEIKKPEYVYETIADVYCISGVASCGDTLTLPSEAQGKAIEGIILNKPYSIYDENIKTIVIGSQMHTVPVSTLNMVFPNLEAFVVGNNNPYIAQIDGCLYNKKVKTLIACPATKTELTIPEGIVGIEHFACQYAKKLTKVTIPSTCTIIGTSAFEECTSLKEIKFAESSCWVIEEKAFNGCTSLSEIDLFATLCVEIESNAFSGCTKLTNLQLPNTLKKIGNNAFENSPIKEIILPDGLETIGESVFGSGLRSVVIPSNVKELHTTSFTPYCMVSVVSENEHYYAKDGVVFSKANELLFYPYNTKKDSAYEIPNGTTSILCSLGNQIKELTIPSSVSKITAGLPSGSKLYVDSGSYAESYAIEKQYNYESKIIESNDLDWLYAPQENTATALELLETQLSNQDTETNTLATEQRVESVPAEPAQVTAEKLGNRVIYEDELVTITFERAEYIDFTGSVHIHCVVENYSDKKVRIDFENIVCNGWALSRSFVEAPAKCKAKERFILMDIDEILGLTDPKLIESLSYDITVYDAEGVFAKALKHKKSVSFDLSLFE